MAGAGIAFYVVGALFALYLIAAAWRSKDVEYRNGVRRAPSLHTPAVERAPDSLVACAAALAVGTSLSQQSGGLGRAYAPGASRD